MPDPFHLTNLPVEVLLEVVGQVRSNHLFVLSKVLTKAPYFQAKQYQSLKALRLTNHLFCTLVSPILFTKIIVRLSSEGLRTSLGLLNTVSDPNASSIARHVRELVVDRSNEFEDPTSRSYTFPLPAKVDPRLREEFDNRFRVASGFLKGLRSLKYVIPSAA